ncbi:hypothetical protein RDWZM_000718 [Blomia tropicalis]|uniref:Ferritin n=1 Tax=Blomia tropicalis TaxID=40697 RepID=A0A9Q0RNA0_BLOTA|nr:Ferritin heavy polypeptide-like 17 [Blomia tropicalis]KAJ6222173.1 hypothetical protein RDWZM_000718 [Blomia tropicalis]
MGKRNAILSVIICFALTNLTNAIFDNAYKELDKDGDIPANKNNYALNEICLNELQKQMNLEKHASLVYKQMAAFFNHNKVGKKGFAKMFDEQAKEEHEHFEKFLNYINLRGSYVDNFNVKMPSKSTWDSTYQALEDAIELENYFYNEIMRIHRIADKSCKDVHLQNFLENEFIEEQVTSIAQLTKLSTILKNAGSEGFGEYTVDRDLLEGKLALGTL